MAYTRPSQRTDDYVPTTSSGGFGMNTILGLLGTGASLVMNWLGLEEEKTQAEDIWQKQQKIRRQDIARQDRYRAQEMRIQQRQMQEAKQERERAWTFREEERDYNRSQSSMNNFIGILSANPTAKRQLKQIWGK